MLLSWSISDLPQFGIALSPQDHSTLAIGVDIRRGDGCGILGQGSASEGSLWGLQAREDESQKRLRETWEFESLIFIHVSLDVCIAKIWDLLFSSLS